MLGQSVWNRDDIRHTTALQALCVVPAWGASPARIVTGDRDGRLHAYTNDGHFIQSFGEHESWVSSLSVMHHAGRLLLVSASWDKTVRLWDLSTYEQVSVLTGHRREVYAVCGITVNGVSSAFIASGGYDKDLRIVKLLEDTVVPTDEPDDVRVLSGHTAPITCVSLVSSEKTHMLLATGSDDCSVRVWRLNFRNNEAWCFKKLGQYEVPITCLSAIDGDTLVTGTNNGMLVVWDMHGSIRCTLRVDSHLHALTSVSSLKAAGYGRSSFITGSWDGTVKIWDLESLVHDHHDPTVTLHGPAGVVHGVTTIQNSTLSVVAGVHALDHSYLVMWHKPTDA